MHEEKRTGLDHRCMGTILAALLKTALTPEPFECGRQQWASVFAVVFPLGEDELKVIVHVAQGGGHLLIAEWPVAMRIVEIIATVLQPEAEGFGFGGADQIRVGVTASDVGEGADGGEDFAELVGSLPGGGESADATAAGAAKSALGWVAGEEGTV